MKNKIKVLFGRWRQHFDHYLSLYGYRLVKAEAMRSLNVASLVDSLCPNNEAIYFLQIGANDGVSEDPLAFFRQRKEWSGFCLEPNPAIFPKLQNNLREAGNGNVQAIQVALGDTDGILPFFVVNAAKAKDLHLPWYMDKCSSLSLERLKAEISKCGSVIGKKIDDLIETIPVQVIPFETLCGRYNISRVDLLLLDVEGLDGKLLEQFPLERFLPRIVIVEWDKMTDAELKEIFDRFRRAGYCWMFAERDLVLIKTEYLTRSSIPSNWLRATI